MITLQAPDQGNRLTTTEEVFRQLRSSILSLDLPPGAKISEVEVAKACGVSRQPVREAFMRLGALNLLEIKPQKATRVRKISHAALRNTRFIRAAVEVEVVRAACACATPDSLERLAANLDRQRAAVKAGRPEALQELDYEFHRLICQAAQQLPAFTIIAENKAHTDRVCTLELADDAGMAEVLEGHSAIFEAIRAGDTSAAVQMTREHLAHLDAVLAKAAPKFPDFFEA